MFVRRDRIYIHIRMWMSKCLVHTFYTHTLYSKYKPRPQPKMFVVNNTHLCNSKCSSYTSVTVNVHVLLVYEIIYRGAGLYTHTQTLTHRADEGGSNCITQSTEGKSTPRAITSVHINTPLHGRGERERG